MNCDWVKFIIYNLFGCLVLFYVCIFCVYIIDLGSLLLYLFSIFDMIWFMVRFFGGCFLFSCLL